MTFDKQNRNLQNGSSYLLSILVYFSLKEFAYHGLAQTNGVQLSQTVEEADVENGDNNNTAEARDENEEAPGKDLQDNTDGHG